MTDEQLVENVFADDENDATNNVETTRLATRRKLAKRRLSFQKKRKFSSSSSTTRNTTSTTTTTTTTMKNKNKTKKGNSDDGSNSSGTTTSGSNNMENNNSSKRSKRVKTNLNSKNKKQKTTSSKTSKKQSKKNKKNERDIEYLATYTKKLTAAEKKIIEQQRTIFKLKISGSIYGSLARSASGNSRSTSTNIYEVKEKRTLKFKMPQDVYLSLFQASGTGRRLLSVRNKTAPIGFTAFNIFRKEMKLKSLSLNEIAKKWRELDEHARQEYYDKVEEEVTEDEETNGNSTTTTGRIKKKKTSNKTKSKTTKKNITIPFLHEVRRFEDLNELTRIFGPATLRRNVGTILTPTGRIHVAHVVTSPVRFKYDGQKGELGMQFDYKVEYVRPL